MALTKRLLAARVDYYKYVAATAAASRIVTAYSKI